MPEIEKLIELARHKHQIDLKRGIKKYMDTKWLLDEIKEEVDEVRKEIKEKNRPLLEDELGDILWSLFILMAKLENEKYIESFDKVFKRALNKYTQRITPLKGEKEDDRRWQEIKERQKRALQEELKTLKG
ncbi:MAG: nucleotide pyrophosphohydrolase [Epsilonproteobacteria bacterium]|nr:nucleotide pyrophosphohydrolase [Campylobacterota bacterium]